MRSFILGKRLPRKGAGVGLATPQGGAVTMLAISRAVTAGLVTMALSLSIFASSSAAQTTKNSSKKKSSTASSSAAATKTPAKKLNIEADRISDDKKKNLVRAEGNVKVYFNDQLLKCDFLTLDKANNKLWARGNVYFKSGDGSASKILVSQEMEMTGDFKSGVSQALTGRLGDHGSITASESRWEGSDRVFTDASYTNCFLCSPFGDNVPLWRVRASTAVEDKADNTLKLYNGWIEVFNVPILYSPYLSFPNRRGSGLLVPTFKYDTTAGVIFRPSVFVVTSNSGDLLFNPYFDTVQGMIGSVMFRQRFAYTDINAGGIALYDNPTPGRAKQWQGYSYFNFLTSLNREWQISGAVQWAWPQNFFQHYTFLNNPGSPGNDLISYIDATGFISPHYVDYSYYAYQDNRAGYPFGLILVGPRTEFFGRGSKTAGGGQWRVNGDMRYYQEPHQGTNGLVHLDAGWQQPVHFLNGMLLNIDAGIRFDYIASHFYRNYISIPNILIPARDPSLASLGDNQRSILRVVPEIMTTLSYPLIAQTAKNNLVIEPIVGAYFSFGGLLSKKINGGNNGGDLNNIIFDTDSAPLEINGDNLFLRDRALGTSYFEDYGRLAYGLKIDNILKSGGEYKLFIGHGNNWFSNQNPHVPDSLRYNKSSTAIILNGTWIANKYFNIRDSLLLKDSDLSIDRHVAGLNLTYQNVNLGLSYYYYQNQSQVDTGTGQLQQLVPSATLHIGDNWSLNWNMVGDFSTPQYITRSIGLGVTYNDECWYMALTANRVFPGPNVTDTSGWQFGFDWRIVAF
ncbi:MAG: hypothetical protein QM529_03065 [Hydrotalea sp.]|nr:hypothetical protein [Hydrotalea sp.]